MDQAPEELIGRAELGNTLLATAARIPLRDALTLCAISELSIAETAEVLGITAAATKTRMVRARGCDLS